MTRREAFLLNVLAATALGVLVLAGAQRYTAALAANEQKLASLKKEAAQIQTRLVQAQASDTRADQDRSSLWARADLPGPLVLARRLQPVLVQNGVTVKEYQVVSSSDDGFVLKYSLQAPMSRFMNAFLTLQEADSRMLVHRLYAQRQDNDNYVLEWEVGYAALP